MKSRIKLSILLLTCLSYVVPSMLYANELYFSTINGEDGLSESNVKTIIQDSYGFIWFGTKNGLDRYDGKRIRSFDVSDKIHGISDRNVAALLEDNNKQLWIGTDRGVFIFNPVTEKFRFFQHRTPDGTYLDNWVSDIKKDLDGNIWIIIPSKGLFKYIPSQDKLVEHRISDQQDSRRSPQSIYITSENEVWIGSNGIGIFRFNRATNSFIPYLSDSSGNSLADMNIYTMCEYRGKMVLGVHEGQLLQWDIKSNKLSAFNLPEVHYKIIREVTAYDSTALYIATEAGLYVYNEALNQLKHYKEDGLNPYSLSDNTLYSIFRDNEGGIWIGTLLGGVNYAANRTIEFEKHVPSSRPNSLSTKKIRELCEDEEGLLWIGTEKGGINLFDPRSMTFEVIKTSGNQNTNLALLSHQNKIYVGNFKRGLDVIDKTTKTSHHLSHQELGLNEESICALLVDSHGQFWLGNTDEVYLSSGRDFRFKPRNDIANGYVYDIKEDKDGYIWIATLGTGVYKYDRKTDKSIHYIHNDKDSSSLSSNSVSSITIDTLGVVWFSTDRGGICRYNKETDSFTSFSISDGLPDDVAYKILVDKEYNLWFGTNKGLVRFNPKTKSVRTFTKSEGLLGNQFSYKSALISKSGRFYFGGTNGLISFNPYYLPIHNEAPPVYITGMYIHNKEVNVNEQDSPLKESLLHTRSIQLNYTQSNISFDFAALSYVSSPTNSFAYRMIGIDNEWVYTSNQTAFYSQLPPGRYTFQVKGANSDGIWNTKGTSLELVITPPWWKSGIANITYLIIIIFLTYYSFHFYNKKRELKNQQAQQLFEIQKEHELYRSKVDFFTTIAHEIKTPLSLIKAPLEEVNKLPIQDQFVRKSLHIMELNTNRLLTLINQLLDFRKIETNIVSLYYTNENISNLLHETLVRFEPAILSSNKTISHHLPNEELYAHVDKEEFIKIISNLLNNALKYAEHSIQLCLQTNLTNFQVKVLSDGKIIPEDQREKIFKPFFQLKNSNKVNSGVGIGLSLARNLAELHTGSLKLEIIDNIWNSFTLTLPLQQSRIIDLESLNPEDNKEETSNENTITTTDTSGYSLLIVDDNVEILQFLSERLSSHFIIFTASDGKEAITLLKENNIQLVISDVMMPVMNGLALCSYIKGNLEFSHIPVILLTAKNDLDSKIKGLETGADAYLEKPFSLSYLAAQVTNLLENRRKERESFAKRPFLPVSNLKMNKADEEFMSKMMDKINENIADENFNVERLAELLNMSRSALHKKIKNLVDMAPIDFIRVIRLKKAAELILDGKYNMAEISVMIGINSPSYFSKLFYKQFGVTPKNFSKSQKEEKPIP